MKKHHALWRSAQIAAVLLPAALVFFGCSKSTPGNGTGPSPEEITQICVHNTTCEATQYGVGNASNCIDRLTQMQLESLSYYDRSDVYDCMLEAGSDCDALYACLNEGHPMQECDDATFVARCEGTMAIDCFVGQVLYMDCSRYNPVMIDPWCGPDPDDENGVKCHGRTCTDFSMQCIGDTAEWCDDGGEMFRYECGNWNMGCNAAFQGEGEACVGNGAACNEESFNDHCEGTVMVTCAVGKEARLDCAELMGSDYTCSYADGFDCVPAASECDFEEFNDSCDGSTMIVCRSGRIVRLDCRSYGYTTCAPAELGVYCQ